MLCPVMKKNEWTENYKSALCLCLRCCLHGWYLDWPSLDCGVCLEILKSQTREHAAENQLTYRQMKCYHLHCIEFCSLSLQAAETRIWRSHEEFKKVYLCLPLGRLFLGVPTSLLTLWCRRQQNMVVKNMDSRSQLSGFQSFLCLSFLPIKLIKW